MNRRLSVITSTLALTSALAGCTSETQGPSKPVASTESPILGGAATNDPKYQAVGAIYVEVPDFEFIDVVCSATLVAPQRIITARHCTPIIEIVQEFGGTAYMAFGPNAFLPDQLVPITTFVNAPPAPHKPGLLLDGGRDVAVAQLASVPAGITPAKVGRYEGDMIGSEFQIVGYGANNPDFFYGEKFAGTATARAHAGFWYRLLFDQDKQAFLDWYFTDAATFPTPQEAEIWWDLFQLEANYELLAGGLDGEAVACFGDSGGPLLKGTNASNMTTYGVSFAVEASLSTLCTKGGAYAVFNQHMLDFVQANL
jgi:hypothetical protein